MFHTLHMMALSSSPLTAYGSMVLTASGQHPEPWLFIVSIADIVGRENVNIRNKIFQESLIKIFRVLLGVEIRSPIPHFIPH
jgi:hypothetical protein